MAARSSSPTGEAMIPDARFTRTGEGRGARGISNVSASGKPLTHIVRFDRSRELPLSRGSIRTNLGEALL